MKIDLKPSNQWDENFNSCIMVGKMIRIIYIWSYNCKYSKFSGKWIQVACSRKRSGYILADFYWCLDFYFLKKWVTLTCIHLYSLFIYFLSLGSKTLFSQMCSIDKKNPIFISSSPFSLLIVNVKILSNFQKEWCTFGRKKRC
jgi:hypothetical protein